MRIWFQVLFADERDPILTLKELCCRTKLSARIRFAHEKLLKGEFTPCIERL